MALRPNILLITTDMQRFDTLGCAGNAQIKTPNLDALAERGVRFSQAFCNNPVCMPTRATLFSGKLPSAHGVRWNVGGLGAHEPTVTKTLHDAGYQTAAIGKMHWGDMQADLGLEYLNVTHEYTVSPGVHGYRDALREAGLDQVPPVESLPEYREYYGAAASPLPEELHLDSFIGQATVAFLEERDRERPFFCWCSFNGPHLPIDPAKPWDELYDPADMPLPVWEEQEFDAKPPEQRAFQQNKDRGNGFGDYRAITYDLNKLRRFIAHYWGKISMIDSYIGKIIAQLQQAGDLENTVIIFTSDHGDFVGNHRLLFKSAFLYDDLVRVPLIVAWPERLKPGLVVDACVEHVDLPVSILRMAGLQPYPGMQGEDLMPLLCGEADALRDHAYAEAVDHRMLRTAEWKLVHYMGRPLGELYNLREDPHELKNLYDDPDCLAVREALERRLLDRMLANEGRLHTPVRYLELNDPQHPEAVVRLPWI